MGRLNKPAKAGYTYRSPRQTNAEDLTPNLMEDFPASQAADLERVRKGVSPTANARNLYSSDINRRRQQEAGGRATLRTLNRLGMAGMAGAAGAEIGQKLDERYPSVGEAAEKLIEKSGVGALARRGAVSPGRVELTDEAKQRIEDEEATRDVIRARKQVAEERGEEYKKGGKVTRGDGIAQRGKTRGRYL